MTVHYQGMKIVLVGGIGWKCERKIAFRWDWNKR